MITAEDFRQVADERMADCRALLAAGRYDAATYLSGYVLEAALKACICDTLGWRDLRSRVMTGRLCSVRSGCTT
ncbi:MAG: HEPN domain-containing protein [Dehalococcoidia bacterium]|nr:HEPN domain-containing protein [Dehalococcoidia bacterium]